MELREGFHPGEENFRGFPVGVEKFQSHSGLRFRYADDGEPTEGFAVVFQGKADARADIERPPAADKAATEGEIGSDTLEASAGLEIEDLPGGGERETNGIAAVTQTGFGGGIAAVGIHVSLSVEAEPTLAAKSQRP